MKITKQLLFTALWTNSLWELNRHTYYNSTRMNGNPLTKLHRQLHRLQNNTGTVFVGLNEVQIALNNAAGNAELLVQTWQFCFVVMKMHSVSMKGSLGIEHKNKLEWMWVICVKYSTNFSENDPHRYKSVVLSLYISQLLPSLQSSHSPSLHCGGHNRQVLVGN